MLTLYTLLALEAGVLLVTAVFLSHALWKKLSPLWSWLIIVCICTGTIALNAYYRGFFHIQFAIAPVCIAPFILGILLLLLKQKRASIYFLSLVLLLFSVTVTTIAHSRAETENLKRFCGDYATQIETYAREHTTYPASLTELEPPQSFQPLAVYIHGQDALCGYHRPTEDHYSLFISTGPFSGWVRGSETPFWWKID